MARRPGYQDEPRRTTFVQSVAWLVCGAGLILGLTAVPPDVLFAASGNQDGCNVALYQADGRSLDLYQGATYWAGPFETPDGSFGFGPLTGFALPSGHYRVVWDTGAVDRFTIDCPAYSAPTPAPRAPRPTPQLTLPPTDTAE